MVQCMELQIRKQINFPNESVLQQVSDWRHCDNYISTVCRALYIVSAKILHTTPLSLSEWLIIIPIAGSIILVEEIRKFFYRRKLI